LVAVAVAVAAVKAFEPTMLEAAFIVLLAVAAVAEVDHRRRLTLGAVRVEAYPAQLVLILELTETLAGQGHPVHKVAAGLLLGPLRLEVLGEVVAAGVLVVAREAQLLHRILLVAILDPDPTAVEAQALRYRATPTSHGQQRAHV
jgi:hypothetical protein